MGVLSVSIITKGGRPLVARQYGDLTRTQINGHLGAFPKLVNKNCNSYIETDTVRYVFQEIGEMYFIIIATKDSNILEDLDLLSLLVDLTRRTLETLEEKDVLEHSLDLIIAYDECVFDGYKQNVSIDEVEKFIQMESLEENRVEEEIAKKEQAAAESLRKHIREMKDKKKQQQLSNTGFTASVGYVPNSTDSSYLAQETKNIIDSTIEETIETKPKPTKKLAATRGKGMSLRKNDTARQRMRQMIEEEGLQQDSTPEATKAPPEPAKVTKEPAKILKEGVTLSIEEKVSAHLTRKGALKELYVNGVMNAVASDKGLYEFSVKTTAGIKLIPMNQRSRTEFVRTKVLQFDNQNPGAPLTLLQWRIVSADMKDLPLSASCWYGSSGGGTSITLELDVNRPELNFEQAGLVVPFPSPSDIVVKGGDGKIEVLDGAIMWVVGPLGEEGASIELEGPSVPEDALYPINLSFRATELYAGIDVEYKNAEGQPTLTIEKSLVNDEFEID